MYFGYAYQNYNFEPKYAYIKYAYKKMSASYPKLINFREDFFLRGQRKWVIFLEVLCYYFHEPTSLAVFTKNDLSRQEKRKISLTFWKS